MGNNNAIRDALIAAGVMPVSTKQRFNSFRAYFANTDIKAELAAARMPESKQVKLEDFQSSEQLVDFTNLVRNRLYRSNVSNGLKDRYIALLESNMLRAGLSLPNNKPVSSEVSNETIGDKSI